MITSTSNNQIKQISALMSKAKCRREQQAFVVEGIRMFLEIPEELHVKTYVAEDSLASKDARVQQRCETMDYEIVSQNVFKSISGTVSPQGILSIVCAKEYTLTDMLKSTPEGSLYMVLEDLQDPGNLGTIMRTAEACGVTGVIMSKQTVDIYNPKVIRSTMGTIFRVPFLYVEDICGTVQEMKKAGIITVAAHLSGNVWYDEIDYKKNTAFLIGNEGNGLTDQLTELADVRMKIPMLGQVESLNAAVASSVLMYEAYRQRRK